MYNYSYLDDGGTRETDGSRGCTDPAHPQPELTEPASHCTVCETETMRRIAGMLIRATQMRVSHVL